NGHFHKTLIFTIRFITFKLVGAPTKSWSLIACKNDKTIIEGLKNRLKLCLLSGSIDRED
ncbi:hypothetical protein, partial [Leptospira venezuelensis]